MAVSTLQFDRIAGYNGLAKLTHKMTHQKGQAPTD